MLVNGAESGQAFRNCLTFSHSDIDAYNSLLKYPFVNNGLINNGDVMTFCCGDKCSSLQYKNEFDCPAGSLPFYCIKVSQSIFCGKNPCRGIVGDNLVVDNVSLGNCTRYGNASLPEVVNYVTSSPENSIIGIDKGYAFLPCSIGSPCYGLVGGCWWDNGGWTCSFISDKAINSCILQWPAPWPGVSSLNPTLTTILPTSTNTASTASTTFTPQPENGNGLSNSDKIALGTGIGVGLPATIATVIGVWFTWRDRRKKREERERTTPLETERNALGEGNSRVITEETVNGEVARQQIQAQIQIPPK